MVLVITGLAAESRIAAGPGVSQVVCSGSEPDRLRDQLSRLAPTGLRAVVSFGIAGGLDPSLNPGDVVVATAVIADSGIWKVPCGVVSGIVEQVRTSGIRVAQGPVVGIDMLMLLPTEKAEVRRETNAIAIDMESHVGAAYAASHDLPFAAIRVVSALIDDTAVFRSCAMPACWESIWFDASWKRDARSPTRASTTCRADASCGLLETSTKAL